MNIEFNSNILNSLSKDGPIITDSFSKSMDSQLVRVAKHLTPRETVTRGYLKNLLLAKNNMTQSGMQSTHDAFVNKLSGITSSADEEINEIAKLVQTAGFILRDENIPKEYFKLQFFGNAGKSMPEYVGLTTPIQFKLDNNLLMKTENFTEKDVINHFNDVKAYWSILDSGASSGVVELVKKINTIEDEFFTKARDFNSAMSGKLFNRPFNTVSLCLTSKGSKNVKYYTDPWIGFCVRMESLRIKDSAPNFMISFDLASFSDMKEVQNKIATYFASITLFYKVTKPFIGSFKFERNGIVY